MEYFKAYRLPVFIAACIFCLSTVCNARTPYGLQEGILGSFDPRAAAKVSEDVILQRTNLFGDMIPISPAERHLRLAYKQASLIRQGDLVEYYAVYYIFPESGTPIVLNGILMPASESLAGVHLASMHFTADDKTIAQLKTLPRSTLVYGVDAGGNKAWWPLEFFAADMEYPGYFSAVGLYAYTYRPSAKLAGRYGNTAFYLDIIDPDLLDGTGVIPEENLTVYTENLPDAAVKVAHFAKPAFFSKIIPLLGIYPEYGTIPYEIAFLKPEGKTRSVELRLPAGLPHHHNGDSICIAPAPGMFDALQTYCASILSDLYAAGEGVVFRELLGSELVVSHYNEAGEVDIIKASDEKGTLRFCPEIYIRPHGDETFHHVHDFNEDMTEEGIFIFLRDSNDPDSEELFSLLESHLAGPCYGEWPPVNEPVAVDWTEGYDTVLHGIEKLPRSRVLPGKEEEGPYVEPGKLFVLDILPSFNGRGIEGFRKWLLDEMGYRPFTGLEKEAGFVVFEFIVASDGKVSHLHIVDVSHMHIISDVARTLSHQEILWSPGEISGFPVNVKLRVTLEFAID